MTLEESMQMIDTLKQEKAELQTQVTNLTNEKETLTTLSETLKNDKKELSKQVTSLKESNMKYFERLTFQNNNIKDDEQEQGKQEEETTSIDDVINSFLQ